MRIFQQEREIPKSPTLLDCNVHGLQKFDRRLAEHCAEIAESNGAERGSGRSAPSIGGSREDVPRTPRTGSSSGRRRCKIRGRKSHRGCAGWEAEASGGERKGTPRNAGPPAVSLPPPVAPCRAFLWPRGHASPPLSLLLFGSVCLAQPPGFSLARASTGAPPLRLFRSFSLLIFSSQFLLPSNFPRVSSFVAATFLFLDRVCVFVSQIKRTSLEFLEENAGAGVFGIIILRSSETS